MERRYGLNSHKTHYDQSPSSLQGEQYGAERFPRRIYSGFMLDNLPDLNRKIRQKCERMSVEHDREQMLVLAGELEQLFVRKDLVTEERNRVYRAKL
jgi:hypothetical protein